MFAPALQFGRTRTWVLVSEHKSHLKAKHKELSGTESTLQCLNNFFLTCEINIILSNQTV